MTFMLIVILVAITVATGFVLADSGLRMWSAVVAIKARQDLAGRQPAMSALRVQRAARITTRVSFERGSTAQRAAA